MKCSTGAVSGRGELLALTPGDFDFEKQTVSISKSYQRIKGKDVITDPKTARSNRVIQMPAFLCDKMQDYIKSLYAVEPTDRIFTVTKSYLHREMDRGAKEAGVKRTFGPEQVEAIVESGTSGESPRGPDALSAGMGGNILKKIFSNKCKRY